MGKYLHMASITLGVELFTGAKDARDATDSEIRESIVRALDSYRARYEENKNLVACLTYEENSFEVVDGEVDEGSLFLAIPLEDDQTIYVGPNRPERGGK